MSDLTERLRAEAKAFREQAVRLESDSPTAALLTEAAARIEALEAELERAREALNRQCDNMAFLVNHAPMGNWHEKFSAELAEDRQALATTGGAE